MYLKYTLPTIPKGCNITVRPFALAVHSNKDADSIALKLWMDWAIISSLLSRFLKRDNQEDKIDTPAVVTSAG